MLAMHKLLPSKPLRRMPSSTVVQAFTHSFPFNLIGLWANMYDVWERWERILIFLFICIFQKCLHIAIWFCSSASNNNNIIICSFIFQLQIACHNSWFGGYRMGIIAVAVFSLLYFIESLVWWLFHFSDFASSHIA